MRYTRDRYSSLSRSSRTVFWVILAAMIVIGLFAFFTSEIGRNITLICCGGIIVLIVVGIVSENGMRRR